MVLEIGSTHLLPLQKIFWGYDYPPLLTKSSIRLLHITSVCHDTIECSMRTVALDDSPRYNCLSYTWGNPWGRDDPERQYAIRCDGRYILIRENLHSALCHLWRAVKEELEEIWIDAVCINQDDLDERSNQVSLMKRIYQSSAQVLVWLGPEDEDSRLAASLVGQVRSLKPEVENPGFLQKLLVNPIPSLDTSRINWDIDIWRSLDCFFKRAYFARAWIIQEIVVAQSHRIFCGTTSMDWFDLAAFSRVHILNSPPAQIIFRARAGTTGQKAGTPGNISLLYKLQHCYSNSGHIYESGLDVLRGSMGMFFIATDARDLIFSMKSMVSDFQDVNVDYTRHTVDVFEDVTWSIMERSSDLEMLCVVEPRPNVSQSSSVPNILLDFLRKKERPFPSWVPNFATTLDLKEVARRNGTDKGFMASAGTTKFCERNGHILRLHGTLLAKVKSTSETNREMMSEMWSLSRLFSLLENMSGVYTQTGQSREEALFQTLFGWHLLKAKSKDEEFTIVADWIVLVLTNNLFLSIQNGLPQTEQLAQCYILGRLATCDRKGLLPSPLRAMQLLNGGPELLEHGGSGGVLWPVTDQVQRFGSQMLGHRRVFSTDRGLIGTSFETIQSDDEVWILKGGKVPYVLRPSAGGRYRLIGAAYVHGVMHGEAITEGNNVNWRLVELE